MDLLLIQGKFDICRVKEESRQASATVENLATYINCCDISGMHDDHHCKGHKEMLS